MTAEEFKDLLMPMSRKMFRTALGILGNAADAEDAVQNALVRIWEGRSRLQLIESVEAYAITSARNAALDLVNSRRYSESLDSVGEQPAEADRLDSADRVRLVLNLIDALPENQRLIITLKDVDGLSTDEVITRTGLSAANVRTLLCRARATIRQHFNPTLNL